MEHSNRELPAHVPGQPHQHVVSYDGTGGSESSYETKGITYLASSGDSGLGLYDPATFQDVIAVGGTVLSHSTSTRGYNEIVWPSTGG